MTMARFHKQVRFECFFTYVIFLFQSQWGSKFSNLFLFTCSAYHLKRTDVENSTNLTIWDASQRKCPRFSLNIFPDIFDNLGSFLLEFSGIVTCCAWQGFGNFLGRTLAPGKLALYLNKNNFLHTLRISSRRPWHMNDLSFPLFLNLSLPTPLKKRGRPLSTFRGFQSLILWQNKEAISVYFRVSGGQTVRNKTYANPCMHVNLVQA